MIEFTGYENFDFFWTWMLITMAALLVIYFVGWLIGKLIRHIRFRRWADQYVWYIDGRGNYYRKDHSHDYERNENDDDQN